MNKTIITTTSKTTTLNENKNTTSTTQPAGKTPLAPASTTSQTTKPAGNTSSSTNLTTNKSSPASTTQTTQTAGKIPTTISNQSTSSTNLTASRTSTATATQTTKPAGKTSSTTNQSAGKTPLAPATSITQSAGKTPLSPATNQSVSQTPTTISNQSTSSTNLTASITNPATTTQTTKPTSRISPATRTNQSTGKTPLATATNQSTNKSSPATATNHTLPQTSVATEKAIVLTGGGTAGHVTVNISLESELKKHFTKIYYIGSKNGIEKTLIKEQTSYKYFDITTTKFNRSSILKNLSLPFKLLKGIKEAKQLLKKINPKIIFSKGGYVGLPVVIAGKKLGIPVICHESDLTMGLANKVAKKYAKIICTNFKQTAEQNGSKCVFTGMPVKISSLSKLSAKHKINAPQNKPTLLIIGGSMGAKAINEFVFQYLDTLTKSYYVLHIVGKNNLNQNITLNSNIKSYRQIEFSNEINVLMRACDLAISRAGANTAIELLANNVPTLFIPLPKKASRGDQIENANYLKSQGLCDVLLQENLTIDALTQKLTALQKNTAQIQQNIKNNKICDGTQNIIKQILSHQLS